VVTADQLDWRPSCLSVQMAGKDRQHRDQYVQGALEVGALEQVPAGGSPLAASSVLSPARRRLDEGVARAVDGDALHRRRAIELSTVRHSAVTDALQLLAQPPTARLKQCPGDQCGWLFLDSTKRGNRRWCEMRKCGQEAKDHHRRRQQRRRST